MFRTPLLSIKSSIARGQKFLSTTTAAAPEGYAVPVKIFHWTMGISMLACVGTVLKAQNSTKKEDKANAMFIHKSFGMLAACLLVPRLITKLISKNPAPLPGSTALETAAGHAMHYVLYGFAIVLPVSGVIMGSFSGFGLPFFFTTVPSVRKEPAVAKQAYDIHKIAGQAFEYIVPLHIGAAFLHVFRGHQIFSRILYSSRKPPAVPK